MGQHDHHTPESAAGGIEGALRLLEGRWKLLILFQLFGGKTLRFSELERAIPGVSQKMLIQQLRQLEATASCGASCITRSRPRLNTSSPVGGRTYARPSTRC